MNVNLMGKLRCPLCKDRLRDGGGILSCGGCGETYTIVDGMPNFLPSHLMSKYDEELKEQDLKEEMTFYDRMYEDLKGMDDGHCVVYGYNEIYEFMSDIPRGSLLDIGCGAGHHSKDLSLLGYEVTGVDISLNGLKQARAVSQSCGQNVDFMLADVENLPFKDDGFDVVFCSLIIHHFPRRNKLISEIARVCSKHFVTFEVNSYDPISFLRFNIINPTIGISSITKNQRTVSPDALKRELRKSGFTEVNAKFVDVHHSLGRDPTGLESKMLRLYRHMAGLLPYKFRFNKFIMKATKGYF